MPSNSKTYMLAYYHRKRKEAISAFGGKCIICSEREHLELHHIDGNGNPNNKNVGGLTRLFEVIKNPSNIALLCTYHHDEYHSMYPDNINHDTLLDYILFKYIENWDFSFL